jgi:hypothetical protein
LCVEFWQSFTVVLLCSIAGTRNARWWCLLDLLNYYQFMQHAKSFLLNWSYLIISLDERHLASFAKIWENKKELQT